MARQVRKKRPPAWHFLKCGASVISLGSKAEFAIKEARRFGARGRELQFALRTVQNRVLERGREMRAQANDFSLRDDVRAVNALYAKRLLKSETMAMLKEERRRIQLEETREAGPAPPKPSIDLNALRPKLAKMIKGLISFGWDTNIATRFATFHNLMNETKKPECKQVCQWLEQNAEYYLYKARQTKNYREYADLADFVVRCYGAAGNLYSRFGFKSESTEVSKKNYALIARLGLA